ncbi:hypothetical protein [Nocardia rhizosphaerihabitans]|uniref:Uncharacterized protein n=1 Tax=Nocardia rhizosphaerihabitans TaxID=1691570 RepID=A0ABQ2L3Y6_9NOCA|nr:hypothetical protein [Nocardia rhizosphaerihabitans]GGN99168.1 hypothetical protein GCM10011610_66840 [Nocardia rhizosphaerihabitans]
MTTVSAVPPAAGVTVALPGSVTASGVDLGAPVGGAVLDESAPRWALRPVAPGSAGSAAGLFSSVGSDT